MVWIQRLNNWIGWIQKNLRRRIWGRIEGYWFQNGKASKCLHINIWEKNSNRLIKIEHDETE